MQQHETLNSWFKLFHFWLIEPSHLWKDMLLLGVWFSFFCLDCCWLKCRLMFSETLFSKIMWMVSVNIFMSVCFLKDCLLWKVVIYTLLLRFLRCFLWNVFLYFYFLFFLIPLCILKCCHRNILCSFNCLGNTANPSVASREKGSCFELQCDLWVFSVYAGFLSISKNVHVGLVGWGF